MCIQFFNTVHCKRQSRNEGFTRAQSNKAIVNNGQYLKVHTSQDSRNGNDLKKVGKRRHRLLCKYPKCKRKTSWYFNAYL